MSPVPDQSGRTRRRTPMSAWGEPAVWLTGASLIACLVLIVVIVVLIVWRGAATFWAPPIDRVVLTDGTVVLGMRMETEPTPDGAGMRHRYRVGNRDLGQDSFRWIAEADIDELTRPASAVVVERREWGVFLGELIGVVTTGEDGSFELPEADADWDAFAREHAAALARRAAIERLNNRDVPRIQDGLTRLEWDRRALERAHAEPASARITPASWAAVCAGASLAGVGAWWSRRRAQNAPYGTRRAAWTVAAIAAMCACAIGGMGAWFERPWGGGVVTDAALQAGLAEIDEREERLRRDLDGVLKQIQVRRGEDERVRAVFVEPTTGRMSPTARSQPDDPMVLSDVVRVVRANDIGLGGRVRVYLARWWEYLAAEPRSNGAEGGVWPAILGTVTLTMLLTVAVVPLGVIAALYLREYAHQGVVTSLLRIAINNLAGVPSIVYGMFGLGFFCYALGGWVDAGPALPATRGVWWWGLVATGVIIVGGVAATVLSAHPPGRSPSVVNRVAAIASWVLWVSAVGLGVWLIARTPYFDGWFSAKLPERPTFGGRGILWASMTLALLTLPVVIVATEEAISAVPGSMREGSLAAGASRWQTIRRIVLPGAMPGIMTGSILAMARGAGEVAPLMLVGAVNFTQASPVTGEAPFLHGDRTFMHLGFHIYNLGFQSPDAQATEPMVWTTTLLLVGIVLVLNLAAITIRARLRSSTGAEV